MRQSRYPPLRAVAGAVRSRSAIGKTYQVAKRSSLAMLRMPGHFVGTANRRATVALVASLVFAPQIAAPEPSTAYLGSQNCGPSLSLSNCIANNYIHTVYPSALTTNIRNDLAWILENQYDTYTQLSTSMDADTNADVLAYDWDYGPSPFYYAAVFCPTSSTKYGTDPNVVCRPMQLRFNLYWTGRFDSQYERRQVACHELGHTVGLHHRNHLNSCMNEPPYTDILELIDIQEINDKYYPY